MRETAKQFCVRLKMLDKRFATSKKSPLHHDNRCEVC